MPRIIDALEQLFTVDSLASGPSLLINYSSAVGSFSVGETVTGGTSGATLVVNTSIPPQVTGSTVTGTFQVGETITGGTSGATATVDNFFLYDFPAGAAPLENGEIDFFESGSSTVRKTTYSDAAETIPNANPLVIRGDGRVPDVYGSGTYRIVVRTSTGIQILARDPIGGDQGLTFGADWSATIVYSETDVVRDDGRYWQSITDNNAGNQPSIDGGINWIELPFTDIANNTASLRNVIVGSGQTYDSANLQQNHIAAATYSSDGDFYSDSGIANAYVLSALAGKQSVKSFRDGMRFRFRTANANTGASTTNVAGLGIKNIVNRSGNALTGGEIPSSRHNRIVYDLANDRFILETDNFINFYQSSGIPIVSAGAVSLTHGLGGEPRFISYKLQCIIAESNYSIGDRIDIGLNSTTTGTNSFSRSKITTSEISFRFSSSANVFVYANESTGNATQLTNANWELYVEAMR